MSSRNDPVVGVMARAPLAGHCKTRLARAIGAERAAEVYRAMLLDTLAACSTLPFSRRLLLAAPENDGAARLRALAPPAWSVREQVGANLGARLAHARSVVSGDALILASSDSPTAPLQELRAALAAWNDPRQVLLGPCDDGGYYLIGLAIPETRVFDGIPWSTNTVLERTVARCRELGLEVRELPMAYDVDEPEDLERLTVELAQHPMRAPRTAAVLRRG
jgi:hypothetical protein